MFITVWNNIYNIYLLILKWWLPKIGRPLVNIQILVGFSTIDHLFFREYGHGNPMEIPWKAAVVELLPCLPGCAWKVDAWRHATYLPCGWKSIAMEVPQARWMISLGKSDENWWWLGGWMVYFRENPIYKWMMTGGSSILGNPHVAKCGEMWNHPETPRKRMVERNCK